ncbi:MAG: sulfatase [Pseudomonadales bacterium]
MKPTRPNILLILTDQQRADHVGYAGNNIVRTPNIDSLAAAGSWFDRFFVASPTCMSNRASLMTGRMPSQHGVRYNGVPLDYDYVTFVEILRSAGYRTALIGKSHLQGMQAAPSLVPRRGDAPSLQAPPEMLAEARKSYPRMDRYNIEVRERWLGTGPAPAVPDPYYGFEHVEFTLGHGDEVTGHYESWLRHLAPEQAGRRGAKHARAHGLSGHPQIYQPSMDETLYPTRYVAERTCAWLEAHARAADKKPFFLQCSFPDPHHPFTPPGRYWDMYDPDAMDPGPSFRQPAKDAVPPMSQLWREFEAGAASKRWTYPFVADESQTREMIAKTFGQITFIDDAVGQVLAALSSTGLAGDTVVCFMSDHGDYLGDHGLMLKGPMHYQSLIRTPFVWRDVDPAFVRGRISSLASTIDFASTVLERVGLAPFHGIQGRSLVPVLIGERSAIRRSVLVEQTTQFAYLGFDDVVMVHTLFDGRWRLSVWEGCDWGELYDLQSDPLEAHNLWDSRAALGQRSAMLLKLIHSMQNHADRSPFPTTVS